MGFLLNNLQKIVLNNVYGVFAAWLLVTTALQGCASDPGKTRMEDPVTVGLSLLQYRPAHWIGLALEFPVSSTPWTVFGDPGTSSGRRVAASNAMFSMQESFVSMVFYPWMTSSFYLGIQGSTGTIRKSYDVANIDGMETTRVKEKEVFVTAGPAIGWTFIGWLGLTLNVDIGPRFTMSKKRTYTAGADGSGVDEQKRDQLANEIDAAKPGEGTSIKYLHAAIGISF